MKFKDAVKLSLLRLGFGRQRLSCQVPAAFAAGGR